MHFEVDVKVAEIQEVYLVMKAGEKDWRLDWKHYLELVKVVRKGMKVNLGID